MTTQTRFFGALAVAGIAAALAVPVTAQQGRSLALMPSQYFSADAESAARLTQSLDEQFSRQGYRVMNQDRAEEVFRGMGLQADTHYADRKAIEFGRRMGADLVAYPRLLGVGLPIDAPAGSGLEPQAVVHLRVLNVRNGKTVYFRQIAHQFRAPSEIAGVMFTLPREAAIASAREVLQPYFDRIASR